VAGALTLGVDFGALRSEEQHFFVKSIHQGFRFMNIVIRVIFRLTSVLSRSLDGTHPPDNADPPKGQTDPVQMFTGNSVVGKFDGSSQLTRYLDVLKKSR